MPFIRETILTTIHASGAVHIAPLGIIADGEGWIVAPFRPSKTLDNMEASGVAVANYTDDPRIFAGCLTGRKTWPLVGLDDCPVPRLQAALAHDVLRVQHVTPAAERPRFHCRIAASGQHRPFQGMNRARAAVLEAAILVSRLSFLSAEKIEAEIAYLRIAVDKTAGEDEQQAWSWLVERVSAHLAAIKADRPADDPS